VLGFVGFVREWHGLDAVIAAMAAEPAGTDLRLVWSATVRHGRRLERQAAALGLADRVSFPVCKTARGDSGLSPVSISRSSRCGELRLAV